MSEDELRFPDIVPDSVRKTRVWIHENDDFRSEEELSELLGRMYDYPEDDFFLFTPKGGAISPLVGSALEAIVIVIVETKGHYYPHPKFKRDYVRIHDATAEWDWEREVLAKDDMYFRHYLKLSEKARRKFEMQQLIEMQKNANSNPIKLEPNFMGIGLDLRKAYTWLKQQLKK
jgi:hypothetical protein